MSQNGRDAIQALREKLAFLLRNKFLSENIKQSGIPIDQEAIIAAVARRDLAAAARLVPDEAVEAFAVGGTPADCRKSFEAFLEAGLEEPVLAHVGRPEERAAGLDLLQELARR